MTDETGISAGSGGGVPRAVIAWLYVVAALVAAMIIVGGATRLTDSGLSITEWKPITGAIPPLTDLQWQDAFQKYQQIPEYELVNKGMSLEEFKFIFWWEWGHRFLGRFVGVAFFVPFLFFWLTKQIPASIMPRIIGIFILGGLQGGLGWFMVMSGLVERVDVSQYRLAAHLGLAFVIFGLTLWVAFRAQGVAAATASATGRSTARVIAVLLFVQILLGALVAGIDAGFTFNTWPLMDGELVPDGLFVMAPWYANPFENALTVQFDHRVLAYIVWVLALAHMLRLRRLQTGALGSAVSLWLVLTAQVALGVWTLLAVVPLWLGLLHQAGAIAAFAVSIFHFAETTPVPAQEETAAHA